MKKSRHYQLPTNNELPTNHYPLTTTFPLETTLATALKDCPPGTTFLASVSGGADSTAMLAALAAIRDTQKGFKLRCIHIEHGIRPAAESRGDAEFVRSLCDTLRVPCHVTHIKPGKVAALAKSRGMGIEAAARLYRRRAWQRHLRRLEAEDRQPRQSVRILVAHTADDMRETALMRILRGSGPSGLAAMPASRGHILRPLITASRRDVMDYLAEKNLSWREDSTNTDTKFLRNRIRRLLIPQLNEHFPQWPGAIAALAQTQSLAAEFIRKEAKHRIRWQTNNYPLLTTNYPLFLAQPAIIREEALFQGINRMGIPAKIRRANIRRFAQGNLNAVDLGQLQLRRDPHHITIIALEKDDFETPSTNHYPLPTTHFSPTTHYPLPTNHYFSLLIKAPGSYNLKGIAIEIADTHPADCHPNVFFSLLPLVFRPCFGEFPKAVIVAEDSRGIAAFIGLTGLLQCRDKEEEALQETAQAAGSGLSSDEKRCAVRVTITAQNEVIDVR